MRDEVDTVLHAWMGTSEDEAYALRHIALEDGRRCWAYICNDPLQTSSEDWHVERFAARDLAAYVDTCIAWRRRYLAAL